MLIVLMSLMLDPVAAIGDTDVYQPLNLSEVIVRPDGHVYILNFQEAHITEFDAEGQKIRQIGAKGKGPGEFTFPTQFFFSKNRLYVFDVLSTEVSIFDRNGTFERRIKTPDRGMTMRKLQEGWIYYANQLMQTDEPIRIFWADDNFENPVELAEFENPGFQQGMMVMQDDNQMVAKFSPLSADPMLVTSADGNRAIIVHGEEPVILPVNQARRELGEKIKLDYKRIPFDYDWAEERLAQVKERSAGRFNAKIQTNFPDYFPAFKECFALPTGGYALNRWAGRPDDIDHPIFVDEKWQETKCDLSWDALKRITGYHGDYVWVTTWDSTEEVAGLARVSLKSVNQFVAEHPIEFDGQAGRSISISE